MMIRTTLFTVLSVSVGACASLPFSRSAPNAPTVTAQPAEDETARPQPRPSTTAQTMGAIGLTPDALDRTTPQERARAVADSQTPMQGLGATLASLGSPTESGFWLRTGLVTRVQTGRVELADGSRGIQVELRPSGAAAEAGSQLSLAAFRALEAPLTQLLPLRVFAE